MPLSAPTETFRGKRCLETLYLQAADACFERGESSLVGISELSRGAVDGTREELLLVLSRLEAEGMLARVPGPYWRVRPFIRDLRGLAESLRYRTSIEPGALLEPSFAFSAPCFARIRDGQRSQLTESSRFLAPSGVFACGADFHGSLVKGAGNASFVRELARQIQRSRFIAYRVLADSCDHQRWSQDRIEILDLLEAGCRDYAATALREHLESVGRAWCGQAWRG